MKDRLEYILKRENLTSVKFAEIMGVQPSNISHILSGRNNPSFDFITKLMERFPDINMEWFLSGQGESYKSESTTNAHTAERELFTSVNTNTRQSTPASEPNTRLSEVQFEPENRSNSSHIDSAVTSVNNNSGQSTPASEPNTRLSEAQFEPENIPDGNPVNNIVTSVNIATNPKKKIMKIIVLYSDNSFHVYENNPD